MTNATCSIVSITVHKLIVPTFKEYGIPKLRVVFLFSQFSSIKIKVFDKIFSYSIEDINFLIEFKIKKIFYLQLFFLKHGGFENCQIGHVWD